MNSFIKNSIITIPVLLIIILFGGSSNLFSQQSPLYYKGGVDSLIYNADTVMIENTIADDGSVIGKENQLTVGFSLFSTGYLKMFYIPISYFLADNLKIDFSLPFINKSMEDDGILYSKNGYGDTKLGTTFIYNLFYNLKGFTSFKMTLPTGDATANESGFIVPLGYGGYSYSLLQTFSIIVYPSFRLFINGGSTFYSDSSTEVYTIENNFVYYMLVGCEYSYSNNLFFQLKANYINIPERKYLIKSTSVWYDRNDSLTASHIIAAIKYLFANNITGNFMAVYPIYEKQDSDISNPHKEGWKILISLEKRFDDEKINYKKK